MSHTELIEIKSLLVRIAAAVEGQATPAAAAAGAGSHPQSWQSPVPPGYQTVLGYLEETHPERIELMSEPFVSTQCDDFWLTHQAKKRDRIALHVDAPKQVHEEFGLTKVRAYPVDLLRERLD